MSLLKIFSHLILVFCLIFFFLGKVNVSSAEGVTKATLKQTSDDDRRILAYATKYYIELELKQSLTLDQIEDAQTFTVTNEGTGKSVFSKRATWAGGEVEKGIYKRARLWGGFRPDIEYRVIVRYPNNSFDEVNVDNKGIKDFEQPSLFQLFSDRATFTFEPMVVEDTNNFGFKYDFKFGIAHWLLSKGTSHRLSLSLTSYGELTTDLEDEKIQSSLKNGFSLDYRYHPRITLSVPQPGSTASVKREYTYPIGFRIKPVEFESNQNFELVDYTAKLQLAITVPFSELPILWWHAKTGVNRPFFPLLIFTGYTFVEEVNRSSDLYIERTSHRWDGEILYFFPLSNRIDFGLRWRMFLNLEEDNFEDLLELSFKYYVTDSRDTGIEFSYQDGALPPEFKDTESFRLGLSIKFL